jgi:ankyrin repeat protein
MLKGTDFMSRILCTLVLSMALTGLAQAGSYEDSLSSAHFGDTRQLVQLLNRGVDPNTVDGQGNTLLMLAAREGHGETVNALLKYRPKLSARNQAGDSALMLAVLKSNAEIVELLLAAGAEVNHDGWTPLAYAAFEGHVNLLERLIEKGADVNALVPNKSNALMLAARNGHIEVVRRLLKLDVNVDQKNDSGFTAESWALSNGNTDIAELIRAARNRRR